MKFQFTFKFLFLSILLFVSEVLIATTFKDNFFVRAYLGDVIVVILMYTMVRTLFRMNNQKLIIGIFIFSCFVEVTQYFHLAEVLGFPSGSIMNILMGNSFSWIDILCYFVGCLMVWISIQFLENKKLTV